MNALGPSPHCSYCKSMGTFGCHGTTVLIQSAPKPNEAFPPTPVELHIKFDQAWPTCLRDIQV